MIPVYRDIELSRDRKIPVQPPSAGDYWKENISTDMRPGSSFVSMPIDPDMGVPRSPSDECLMPPLDVSAPKGLPFGIKLWHLIAAVGLLVVLKKR